MVKQTSPKKLSKPSAGGPMGARQQYKRSGTAPNPSNTGAAGKPTVKSST